MSNYEDDMPRAYVKRHCPYKYTDKRYFQWYYTNVLKPVTDAKKNPPQTPLEEPKPDPTTTG